MSSSKIIKIGTHGGDFHPDEIGAIAILKIALDCQIEIYRTRDEKVLKTMDYLVDVGNVYDNEKYFDHHQPGGAGKRNNGIPYASFGLMWKKFGLKLCSSKSIVDSIDKIFIQQIDAIDNGLNLGENSIKSAGLPFFAIVKAYRQLQGEDENIANDNFHELVDLIAKVLKRAIAGFEQELDDKTFVKDAYNDSEDKRIVVLGKLCQWESILRAYPEPIYAVFPKDDLWRVMTVEDFHFKRKSLPEKWAGLPKEELAKITGVKDAVFCHKNRFVVVAESREGAIALAKLALNF